jgi:hypothetical protein
LTTSTNAAISGDRAPLLQARRIRAEFLIRIGLEDVLHPTTPART